MESRRWQKIADELGNRTAKQVHFSGPLLTSQILRSAPLGLDHLSNIMNSRVPFCTLQVASRVQKYFIKLTKAGIPVPGRTPNLCMYTKKVFIHLQSIFIHLGSCCFHKDFVYIEFKHMAKMNMLFFRHPVKGSTTSTNTCTGHLPS